MIKKEPIQLTDELIAFGGKDAGVLERFMKEFFPFAELKKAGFFSKELKGDYYGQAKRVCQWFNYKSVFEYGAKEVKIHLSYAEGKRPEDEEFITTPKVYSPSPFYFAKRQ